MIIRFNRINKICSVLLVLFLATYCMLLDYVNRTQYVLLAIYVVILIIIFIQHRNIKLYSKDYIVLSLFVYILFNALINGVNTTSLTFFIAILLLILILPYLDGWYEPLRKLMFFFAIVFLFFTLYQKIDASFVENISAQILSEQGLETNVKLLERYYGACAGITAQTATNAYYLTVLISFCIGFLFINREKKIKVVASLLFCLSLYGVILTQKRGLFIGNVIALLFIFSVGILEKKISYKMMKQLLVFSGVLIFIIIIFSQTKEGIVFFERLFISDNQSDYTTGRLSIYQMLLKDLFESGKIFFGNGLGSASAFMNGRQGSAAAHNIYIQLLYEYGLVGCVLFLWFFTMIFAKTWICNKDNSFRIIALYFQMFFFIYGIMGSPLYINFQFMIYIVICSMCFAKERGRKHEIITISDCTNI